MKPKTYLNNFATANIIENDTWHFWKEDGHEIISDGHKLVIDGHIHFMIDPRESDQYSNKKRISVEFKNYSPKIYDNNLNWKELFGFSFLDSYITKLKPLYNKKQKDKFMKVFKCQETEDVVHFCLEDVNWIKNALSYFDCDIVWYLFKHNSVLLVATIQNSLIGLLKHEKSN